ncbi:MAG: MFS transporter [Clostridium sp.]|nr:MFS transporter [Clostridium sp.]
MENKKNNSIAFIGLLITGFMASLDSSVVALALPSIENYFSVSLNSVVWITTIFSLFNASFLVTVSKIGDQFGRKKILLISIALFIISSIVCGSAYSIPVIIVGRALQGIGAAALMTITIPIAFTLFSKEKLGYIAGIWGAVSSIAVAIGPALGGFITQYASWRYIFYINVPISIVASILIVKYVDESYDTTSTKKVDFLGIIFLTIFLFTLTFSLLKGSDYGFNSSTIISLLIVSILSFIILLLIERRNTNAIFDLSLFKIRNFTLSSFAFAFQGIISAISFTLINFYISSILKYSSSESGVVISLVAIGCIISSFIAGKLSIKFKSSTLSVIGYIIGIISIFLLSTMNPSTSKTLLMIYLFINGVSIGFIGGQLIACALNNVPGAKNGVASGINRMIGMIGTLIATVVLTAKLTSNLSTLGNSSEAYTNTFSFAAIILIPGLILTLFIKDKKAPKEESLEEKSTVNE